GVPQDPSTAARWYRLAAEQGNPDAQMFLGSAYLEGRGVHRDIGSALLWLDLAANTLRGEDRSTCEELLDQATWSASADQLARVQRLAAEWRPKPAEQPPVVPLAARSPARHRRYLATLSD
ncbi:MAG: tetratricopeptide repeat protein, partial [Deferrisomatales bacterium]|nr:tetratricopeptide repeat protein [Deferrisomatales bacterium]